jgi:elongation factor Ts
MQITSKMIAELRARTQAGMMDCKKALEEAGGDMERAAEILRKKGIAKAEKRAERGASQGLVVIEAAADQGAAAMIELNCETDFVARTAEFIALARELAQHAAKHAPVGDNAGTVLDAQPFRGSTVAEVVKQISGTTGEAMALRRVARFEAPKGVVGHYGHHNGSLGVLVEVDGPRGHALSTLARDVSMHVASHDPQPLAVTEADLPAELVARERRIAEEQVAEEGKPENIRGRIVDGKVKKFVSDRTLLGQKFVRDDTKTVAILLQEASRDAGGALTVRRFARFKVGE